jgi:hypothetical protein
MSKQSGGCGGKIVAAILIIGGLSIVASIMGKKETTEPSPVPAPKQLAAPAVEKKTVSPEDAEKIKIKKAAQDAYYSGRKFIEKALKVPSSAKFSNFIGDEDTGSSKNDNGRFISWGTVEAQNALGVPLRETWRTEMQSEGDKWRVVYARLGSKTLLDTRKEFITDEIASTKEFIGLTKEQMITKLGEPIKQIKESSPDGSFMIYTYSEDKGKETFFTIFFSDGIISGGMYNGVSFSK